jgi:ATP-binding cassette, subfamily C (CFTR/MRP), member 1
LGYHANAPVLRDISINLPKSSITAFTGPIGCGKSTVLKTLLGEALPLSGRMSISSDHGGIAYCDQNSWLVSGTIRDNIVGYSTSNNPQFDAEWYKTTLWACCLEEDLNDLPDGDSTKVGSNGDSLSGGQKQRIVCVPGS